MISARTFRLFVSSTFSDFIAEREALQKDVFPELERYCAVKGARFQAVDLSWGITEEAQREHDTMRICLEEVRRCQQLSPRPNFAVLLGDRYGWVPVPARIPQDHWPSLMDAASADERELVEKSYRLDENAIPPVYCLGERDLDRVKASQHEAQLLQALRSCAKRLPLSEQLPYFASATHQEIVLGALSKHDDQGQMLQPDQHVHVYVRHLEGLPQNESAKDFIDWDAATQQVVPGAKERLRGLEAELRRELGAHVHDLSTPWLHHSSNGAVDKAYLKRFCDAFLAHQKALIDAELALRPQADERQQREQAHQKFGAERAWVFAGRLELLTEIARYTDPRGAGEIRVENPAKSAVPLILIGGGGSGKSALLARAAQLHSRRSEGSVDVIVERYIGGVPGTESLMSMLIALTSDVASSYGQPELPIPENAKALAENFRVALGYASDQQPLTLYLDALDQLGSADSAWMLEWLPKELPEYVRLVASVRTGTSAEQSARRRYPRSLIEVPAMNPAEGRAMLEAWLADKRSAWFNAGIVPSKGRRLTPQQRESLLNVFNQTGSALWLKLAYEEASSWKSWDAPRSLPADVQGLIGDIIDQRLISQENHPKVFTERALAYITAGRFGLSEDELNRALGTDVAVRAEFEINEKSQRKWEDKKQLPPILWSRLFFDLQPYLGIVKVDGALLMRWFHREFSEAMKGRYLKLEENRTTIHGALANTFNELERELRPNENNDDGLFKATDAIGKQVSAALRRVMEQPWQLAQAGGHKELQALLTDFGFCMGKCAAGAVYDLEADCDLARLAGVSAFLRTNRHLLNSSGFDSRWPRHRVMLQLALEEYPPRELQSAASQWLKCGQVTWAVSMAPNQTPAPSSILLMAGGHETTRLEVFLDRIDRVIIARPRGHTLAFDGTTGMPLGRVEDMPSLDSEPTAHINDASELQSGVVWPVGHGRWFRWLEENHGGGQDGTASLFVPTRGWIDLPRAHHHEVWHACPLQGGGFATLGINANIGVLVVWNSEDNPEIITIPRGPGLGESHGIVELGDGSLLIWPFMNDGSCAHLERMNGAYRWRVRPLHGTAGTSGALPIRSMGSIERVVIWTTKGEVRLWRMADLPEGVIHRSVPQGRHPHSPSQLARKSIPWHTSGESRQIDMLWRDSNGMIIAGSSSNETAISHSDQFWRWETPNEKSSHAYGDFVSCQKLPADLKAMQEALHIPSLLTRWFSWGLVRDGVISQARDHYKSKGHRSPPISPPTMPADSEKDLATWAKAVIGLLDDGQCPRPHYSPNRRQALLTDLLENMVHAFPHESLPAILQADHLLHVHRVPVDPTGSPLWRLLINDTPNHEILRASIALQYSAGREAALKEAERLRLKYPHCWFLEVSRAILQPSPDMEMLVIASRISGCPSLYRRAAMASGESFGAWEVIENGRQGIWVCGHPNDLKFFSTPEGLLIAGKLSEGIRQFRFVGPQTHAEESVGPVNQMVLGDNR